MRWSNLQKLRIITAIDPSKLGVPIPRRIKGTKCIKEEGGTLWRAQGTLALKFAPERVLPLPLSQGALNLKLAPAILVLPLHIVLKCIF